MEETAKMYQLMERQAAFEKTVLMHVETIRERLDNVPSSPAVVSSAVQPRDYDDSYGTPPPLPPPLATSSPRNNRQCNTLVLPSKQIETSTPPTPFTRVQPTSALRSSSKFNCRESENRKNDLDELDTVIANARTGSCSRGNFALELVRHLFTTEERIRSNVSGKCGKDKLDPARMKIVQEKSFAMYPLSQAEAELTAWPKCVRAIDAGNRALALLMRKSNKHEFTLVYPHIHPSCFHYTFLQHVSLCFHCTFLQHVSLCFHCTVLQHVLLHSVKMYLHKNCLSVYKTLYIISLYVVLSQLACRL